MYETSVLGSILIDSSLIEAMDEYCSIDDFEDEQVRFALKLGKELSEAGKPVTLVTLSDKFPKNNQSQFAAFVKFIGQTAANTPSTVNFKQYCLSVREKADMRRLVDAASNTLRIAGDSSRSLEERLDACQQMMLDAVERKEDTLKNSKQQIKGLVDDLEQIIKSGGKVGLQTGFRDIDNQILGMSPGELYTIAARPAMGKTNLAVNIFSNVVKQDKSALYISLEMTHEELLKRMAADWTNTYVQKFNTAQLDSDEWARLTNSFAAQYQNLKGYIDDDSTQTTGSIRAKARRIAKQHKGLDLLIVDHIGLIDHGLDNETQGLSRVSRELKRMAKDLECPVVALCQLNRDCEKRPDKRPLLSDLRQSGSIEQDSDAVLMIYRDEYYNEDSKAKRVAEVLRRKVRKGQTGTTFLRTEFEYSRFSEIDQNQEIEQGVDYFDY